MTCKISGITAIGIHDPEFRVSLTENVRVEDLFFVRGIIWVGIDPVIYGELFLISLVRGFAYVRFLSDN